MKKQVGYDHVAETRDKRNAEKKRALFNAALETFDRYKLPIDRELMHKEGFYNYFLRLYAETYTTGFPSHMTALERVKMHQVPIGEIKQLQDEYSALRTPFDVNTLCVPDDADYGIYVEGEKMEVYNMTEDMLKLFDDYTYKAQTANKNPMFNSFLIDFTDVKQRIENVQRGLGKTLF